MLYCNCIWGECQSCISVRQTSCVLEGLFQVDFLLSAQVSSSDRRRFQLQFGYRSADCWIWGTFWQPGRSGKAGSVRAHGCTARQPAQRTEYLDEKACKAFQRSLPDFVLVRQHSADALAKQTLPVKTILAGWRSSGHAPIIASIPLCWQPWRLGLRKQRITAQELRVKLGFCSDTDLLPCISICLSIKSHDLSLRRRVSRVVMVAFRLFGPSRGG